MASSIADLVAHDRSPFAAMRRVDIEAASEAAMTAVDEAVRAEVDLRAWDLRFAGALNFYEIARAHGGHQIWTAEDSAKLRAMMAIGDSAVVGDSKAEVPQGFASPPRVEITKTVLAAQARLKAAAEATAAASNGAAPPAAAPSAAPQDADN